MTPLPPRLANALNQWHDRAMARQLVASLEAHGVRVAVRRLQLGDVAAAGFGEVREVYRTPDKDTKDGAANHTNL